MNLNLCLNKIIWFKLKAKLKFKLMFKDKGKNKLVRWIMHRYIWILAIVFLVGCRSSLPRVTQVVSGDTVILDDGRKICYAGVAAPEKSSPEMGHWFEFCKGKNAYLVQNKSVKLVFEDGKGKDGATPAYVYSPVIVDKKTLYLFVNAEMVRFGYAKALPVPKQCLHKDLWQAIWNLQETEAKPMSIGIWANKPQP